MAYAKTNPPAKVAQSLTAKSSLWMYVSADVDDTVNGAGYFTNGKDLGMQVGDPVFVVDTTTPKTSVCYVSAISAGGAATTSFAAVA